MSIKQYSLRSRLLTTATLVLFIFLSLMGLVLDRAFKGSTEQAVAERLLIQIYGLLSVTDLNEAELQLPEALQEPRFNYPGSGLYGLVYDEDGREIWPVSYTHLTLPPTPYVQCSDAHIYLNKKH